uniref:CCHC-type domain-containing protein n=1 Tax=Cannabis sativa TaxID=3483 RepID=A0A803PUX1_CANSA
MDNSGGQGVRQDGTNNDTMNEDMVENNQQGGQQLPQDPTLNEPTVQGDQQHSQVPEEGVALNEISNPEVNAVPSEALRNEEVEHLRQDFLESMTLELEPDFEINAEIARTGILASFFEGGRLCVYLGEEAMVDKLKLLIIHEWPEQGDWSNVDMNKAVFWVKATGLPTPYLNAMNTPRIAAKAGEYKGCDIVDQRALARRGFLKFQVELSTKHQVSPGFFLDIYRGRKEWIQFQYFRLPKFCYNCGHIGHDKKACFRETVFAFPPEGAAVPAFGPWIRAESSVISCFNTRNQLNFFREDARHTQPPVNRSLTPAKEVKGKDKGKGLLKEDIPRQVQQTNENGRLKRKVIRVQEKSPGAGFGKNLKVVDNILKKPAGIKIHELTKDKGIPEELNQGRRTRSVSPRALRIHNKGKLTSKESENEILKKYSSHLIPTEADGRVITTIMAHIGPTYEQMIDKPHKELCKYRNLHNHPEPTHFPWPIYAEEIKLVEELMGPAPINKYEPTPTLFHDPVDVSKLVHDCPQQRKRKASWTLIPYVQRTEENTREFSQEIPILPEFSPKSIENPFKMASGASTSSLSR